MSGATTGPDTAGPTGDAADRQPQGRPDGRDGAVIVTDGLTRRYGELVAVDGLDLRVRRGEVYGLLGPNGAGKTTTILMLLGLTRATAGSATVLGLDPAREPLRIKRRVGYLPDSVGFYPGMTGRQNLAYTARLNGLRPDRAGDRIGELLADVGLADAADEPAGTYSRGMRQRLGIADTLVKDPDILILDEPTIAIDPEGVDEILGLIRRLCDEQALTVLLSSHLLYQVQAICDRVGIFVGGDLVAEGGIDELADRIGAGTEIEVAPAGDGTAALLGDLQAVEAVTTTGDGRHVVTATHDVRDEIARRLTGAGHTLTHLQRRGDELEQIYRRYFRRGEEDGDEHAGG